MAEEIVEAVTEGLKAVQETAKLGGKAIDAAVKIGAYCAEVAGDLPKDMLGIAGDWMRDTREKLARRRLNRSGEILQERGTKTVREVSPSLMVPLLGNAANEADDDLGEIWSRLIADAMDPSRDAVRKSFVDTVKALDPQDARVVLALSETPDALFNSMPINGIADRFRATADSIYLSLTKLQG